MGTYTLPANYAHVWMYANTGESPARWIAADAVKFRQYRANLPLALRNYPPCSPSYGQLIVNGNFSTGDATGWTTSRTNGPDPIVQPYAGSNYGAYLGRYNLNQDVLYQFVCPASPADHASLSFWWWMSSQDSPYVDVDFLYVRVRDANDNLLQTLKTITNRSPQGQWYVESFDLRGYAGQTIRISFEASTDGSYPTHFWIDDVSFAVYDLVTGVRVSGGFGQSMAGKLARPCLFSTAPCNNGLHPTRLSPLEIGGSTRLQGVLW